MDSYPVTFSVDYPDRPLDRVSSAFRILWVIPIGILMGTLDHVSGGFGHSGGRIAAAGGTVILPVVLMRLFRQKYPRWWYDWNLEISRFSSRVTAYLALVDDRYPSTDDHQAVHLAYPEVTGAELNRWLPLVKWLLAFEFVEGVMRWENRVSGYAFTLVTDAYPPFQLAA